MVFLFGQLRLQKNSSYNLASVFSFQDNQITIEEKKRRSGRALVEKLLLGCAHSLVVERSCLQCVCLFQQTNDIEDLF